MNRLKRIFRNMYLRSSITKWSNHLYYNSIVLKCTISHLIWVSMKCLNTNRWWITRINLFLLKWNTIYPIRCHLCITCNSILSIKCILLCNNSKFLILTEISSFNFIWINNNNINNKTNKLRYKFQKAL